MNSNVKTIYIIGPVHTPEMMEDTEKKFKEVATDLKRNFKTTPAIIGNHYWATGNLIAGRKERFKHLISADLVVEMSGVFKCAESQKDRQIAEWLEKSVVGLNDLTIPKTANKKGFHRIIENLLRAEESLNQVLGPVMTNPQKQTA